MPAVKGKAAKASKAAAAEDAPKKRRGRKPAAIPRDDVVVTARVPRGIKMQGDAILRDLAATPTDLVNAAYAYVLEHHELPRTTPTLAELAGKRRTLSPEQKERLRTFLRRPPLAEPIDWGTKSYKELKAEALEEKYARLA